MTRRYKDTVASGGLYEVERDGQVWIVCNCQRVCTRDGVRIDIEFHPGCGARGRCGGVLKALDPTYEAFLNGSADPQGLLIYREESASAVTTFAIR